MTGLAAPRVARTLSATGCGKGRGQSAQTKAPPGDGAKLGPSGLPILQVSASPQPQRPAAPLVAQRRASRAARAWAGRGIHGGEGVAASAPHELYFPIRDEINGRHHGPRQQNRRRDCGYWRNGTRLVRWVDRLGQELPGHLRNHSRVHAARSRHPRVGCSLGWPGTFLPADRQRNCQSMLGKSASVGEVASTTGHTRQTVYRSKGDPVAAVAAFHQPRDFVPRSSPGRRRAAESHCKTFQPKNERVRPYSAESVAAMLRRGSVARRPPIAPPA
jgi:hypothetical protein